MASERRRKVPAATSWAQRALYSSADPSHQWIACGSVSEATSSTHSSRRLFSVGASGMAVVSITAAYRAAGRRGTSTESLELGHQHPILVEHAGVDADGAAVGLGLRLALLQHLRLAVERVAVEHRSGVLELFGGEVGDRLAAHVADGHAERQRVHERADHDVAPLLGLVRIHVVDVQRVVVHRDQAEEVVVSLGHGLRRPVLVYGSDLELLQIAAVGVGAARLASGLVGLEGGGLAGCGGGLAHGCRWSPLDACLVGVRPRNSSGRRRAGTVQG